MRWRQVRREFVAVVFMQRACEQLVVDAEDPVLMTNIRQSQVFNVVENLPFPSKALLNPIPRRC